MVEAVLEKTDHTQIEKLAQTIIDAQAREIAQMNEFRTRKYGRPVPRDAPAQESESHGNEMEGH